jgi:hypothetical protein
MIFRCQKHFAHVPGQIIKGEGGKFYSFDNTTRCLNLLDWTLEDWKDELVGRDGTG